MLCTIISTAGPVRSSTRTPPLLLMRDAVASRAGMRGNTRAYSSLYASWHAYTLPPQLFPLVCGGSVYACQLAHKLLYACAFPRMPGNGPVSGVIGLSLPVRPMCDAMLG
jgi:hypothetical protein